MAARMVGVVLSAFFCNIEETGVEGPMAAYTFLMERQTQTWVTSARGREGSLVKVDQGANFHVGDEFDLTCQTVSSRYQSCVCRSQARTHL